MLITRISKSEAFNAVTLSGLFKEGLAAQFSQGVSVNFLDIFQDILNRLVQSGVLGCESIAAAREGPPSKGWRDEVHSNYIHNLVLVVNNYGRFKVPITRHQSLFPDLESLTEFMSQYKLRLHYSGDVYPGWVFSKGTDSTPSTQENQGALTPTASRGPSSQTRTISLLRSILTDAMYRPVVEDFERTCQRLLAAISALGEGSR